MKKKTWIVLILVGCMSLTPMAVFGAEEVKEAEKTTQQEGEAVLSDDIYSFQLKYGEEVFQLPMAFSELTDRGWELSKSDDSEQKLGTNSYTMVRFLKGNLEISADVINLGINEAALSDCLIGGLSVNARYSEMDFTEAPVELPKGIRMGAATVDDIKAAYGEPSDVYEGDSYTKLTYERDMYQDVEMTVYKEENTFLEVSLRNFTEPEGFDKGSVSTEVPEIVASYEAPTELGADILDPIVEYSGDLYRLPAPVSAFLANGWTMVDVEEGAYAAGGGLEFIKMMKDNQSINFNVYNLTENALPLENCFITELEFAEYDPESIAMKLSGGITLGADREELIALAKEKGLVCEVEDEGFLNIYKNKDTKLDTRIDVWFNLDKSKTQAAGLTYRNEILPE